MARIVDKDTRLIDIDFGPVTVATARTAGNPLPTSVTAGGNGVKQLLRIDDPTGNPPGSFIQYSRIDLEFMTMNNEVMMPVDVSVQRTSPVPLGGVVNGNYYDQIEEYIYIFSRPLNNEEVSNSALAFDSMRRLGLDRSQNIAGADIGGLGTGIPTHEQTIYAEKRMYSYPRGLIASATNGGLTPPFGAGTVNEITGMPVLDSVTTWGTMSAITGPNLHCYRVVINLTQNFATLPPPSTFTNQGLDGSANLDFPPVNITFMCKDPKFTEGQYLTRLANAMNNLPEDGPTS